MLNHWSSKPSRKEVQMPALWRAYLRFVLLASSARIGDRPNHGNATRTIAWVPCGQSQRYQGWPQMECTSGSRLAGRLEYATAWNERSLTLRNASSFSGDMPASELATGLWIYLTNQLDTTIIRIFWSHVLFKQLLEVWPGLRNKTAIGRRKLRANFEGQELQYPISIFM